MTVNRRTLAALLDQQKTLDAIQDGQQRALAARWAKTWDRLESELRTRTLEIAQLGDDVGVDAIVRRIKASRALSDVTGQLTSLLATSQAMSSSNAQAMIARAASDQQALIATQLPPGFTVNLLRHDTGQLDAIVKRTLHQITVRHYHLNARATESMKQALVNAVAIGDNPVTAAEHMVRAVQGEFEGGLARATVIARTEQLDAYRSAAQLEQNSHADVMAGWTWCASLSPRTCPSCLSMHGTVHDADEPGPIDHHQGRCARVPVTKTWEQLGFHGIPEPPGALKPGDGIRWLEQQPGDVQSKIMGPKRLDAWKSGDYPPEDWSVRISHTSRDEHGRPRQDWRDSIHVGPVRTPGEKGLPPVEPHKV